MNEWKEGRKKKKKPFLDDGPKFNSPLSALASGAREARKQQVSNRACLFFCLDGTARTHHMREWREYEKEKEWGGCFPLACTDPNRCRYVCRTHTHR
jgi:hypothetical protein